jgi:tRNA-2-methylthio-N6-dimethylallyladenosine synthase
MFYNDRLMPQSPRKTVYLETFGCQMNVLDSDLVSSQLAGLGYAFTDDRDSADVVLFNTCSVREQAENKVYSRLGELKEKRPGVIVGVLGCMAERDGAGLAKRMKQVDLMAGPGELDKVPGLIDNAFKTAAPQIALQGNTNRRSGTLAAAADQLELLDLSRSTAPDAHRGSAYVRITRGCNKFCTYCVVPFTRGAEVHRPPDHIVDECKRLADSGVIEITLLGQTVNHYRYDHGAATMIDGIEQPQVGPGRDAFKHADSRWNVGRKVTTFADLLKRIHDEVPAIQRLRFVTNYPHDFGDDILQVMADSPRICDYLHVPVQSGSDRMLKLMNREYTAGEYREFIDRVRHYLPGAMLASDFIVGFPGETDEDFQQSVELIEYCRFKNSFIFKYSPRPGTPAIERFTDDVPDEVKRQRNNELLAVQQRISAEIHAAQVGRTFDVFVEGASAHAKKQREADGGQVELRVRGAAAEGETPTATVQRTQLSGRTEGDLIVMFDGDESMVGRIVPVRIESAKPLALFGQLAD